MQRFALGSPSRTRIAVWAIRSQVDRSVYFGGDAMISARELRCFQWIILTLLIPCSWCGPLAAAPYSGGDGTAETPYLLSTAEDLATLANTQADWDKWFILTADVDMKSTPLAKPIGSRPAPFTGVFDGGRHSIRGLAANDTGVTSTPFGLFGVVGLPAVVERLRLIAPSIKTSGNGSIGALAGEVAKGATIQQCSVEGGSVSTPASNAAGGLVGDNGGTVRECYSTTSVTAFGLAGALLGRSTGLVENCTAAAAVTTLKVGTGTAAAGLAGADVGGTVRFCLALSPSVTGARVAGLVGYASPTTKISNSVCNKVAARAVENWPADVPGSAWCEEAGNLASSAFFTDLGWDLQGIWFMDVDGLRLRWVGGGLTAVAKGPSGTVQPDPQTGLARIALDGTQSSDPDGNELQYSWKCLTSEGEPTGIAIKPVADPTIDLPAGTYRIELTVNNGRVDSAPATLTFTVGGETSKRLPTAVVKGPTGVVRPDPVTGLAKITLDGSQSSDPDKKAIKYNWTCLTASGGATDVTISPVANPSISLRAGTYRIELTVSNGTADSTPAVLTISVNAAPTAMIKAPGGTITPDAATGLAKIALDGSSSSDPDKEALKYSWKCLTPSGGATGVTIDPVANPAVNLRAGSYRIELTVNDGAGDSAPFAVMLTVGGTNKPPTAVIRELGGTVRTDPATGLARITLDGSPSSDPDKEALKYSWRCLTPTGEPTGITISPVAKPSVDLRAGTYRIELTVNDGKTDSVPMTITVTAADNTAPTAVIKEPQSAARPDSQTGLAQIVLDGSPSSDPEGDALKYRWRCLTAGGGATTVAMDSVPNPSIRLGTGTYKIELIVNDGAADSAPCTVSVTVNTPPVAEAGDSQNVFDDGYGTRQVKLDGSRSFDPEAGKSQTLVYSWTCATAKPGAASGRTASLVLPVGTHTVFLTVSDGMESAVDQVQIVVMPALTTARTAASPSTVGRTSTIADVKFFLLLPGGKNVSAVDTQTPIYLDLNGTRIPLPRDPTYSHKKYTVVAFADRQKILAAAGATNGAKTATVSLRLKTGEMVCGEVHLEIVPGFGPNLATILAERAGYYLDTKIWR